MLIDAHAHLDRYEDELDLALEEIMKHNIFTLSNSMDLPSYKRNLEIAEKCKLVLPLFGVHPWKASEYADNLQDLNKTIQQSPMLGEIGLDYYFVKDASRYSLQRKVFEFFLTKAKKQEKIVHLHTKGAEKEVLQLLNHYDIRRSVIHWYSGPLDVFHELLDRGAYFTIGIEVLYSEHIQAIAKELPSKQLLTETDNPGGAKWLRCKIGMPQLIRDVIQTLAELRKTTAQAIVQTVQNNFLRLIRDDPWLSDINIRFFKSGLNHT